MRQPMDQSVFAGWDNFYVMLGSSAAALIGLLFVVVTLTAGYETAKASRGATLFMTPTAIDFAVVLATSATALAPSLPVCAIAAVLGGSSLVGGANAIQAFVGIRTRMPGAEPPHWSDAWLYGALPAALYLGLVAAAIALCAGAPGMPPAIAALLLALLLVGIRNAWDLVTWLAPRKKDAP